MDAARTGIRGTATAADQPRGTGVRIPRSGSSIHGIEQAASSSDPGLCRPGPFDLQAIHGMSPKRTSVIRRRPNEAPKREMVPAEVLESMVGVLAAALEMRDDETGEHAKRVTQLGLELAQVVAPELAADPE